MAEIIKTGTIKIDIVRGKSDVRAPDIGPILEAKQKEVSLNEQLIQQEKAVADAAQKAAQAQVDAGKAVIEDSMKRLDGMSQMAEGMLKIGRAAVLAGTAGGASMKELLTVLIAFQIATDLFTGATAALKGFVAWLGAAKIATLGLTGAIAALEAVLLPVIIILAALAAVYLLVASNAEKAREAQEKASAAARQQTEAMNAAIDKSIDREVELAKAIRATMDARERAAAIDVLDPEGMISYAADISAKSGALEGGGDPRTQEEMAGIAQTAVDLLQEQEAAQRSIRDAELERLNYQEQMIQSKVRELDLAREVLKTEEAKTQAFAVQFGMLSKGEQERLKRIDKKISGGEALTKSELQVAMKAGGGFADAAGKAYAEKAKQAGFDNIKSFENPAIAKARSAVFDAAGAISEVTGGASSNEALAQIKAQKAEFEKAFADYLKTNKEMLKRALEELSTINQRQKRVEMAAAKVKGT